jgi:methyltransferase (TIGR00027 family)
VDGTVLYEIDQPKVLEFKAQTLAQHDAKPSVSRYVAVPIDLRQDWPKALRDTGFDATEPAAWAAEGLLPYLPADAQDQLFERICELSAAGSRIGVESFGAGFFDREYLASRREQMRRLREDAGEDADAKVPDTADLWYIEDRTDVVEWLTEHNWEASGVESIELMTRYGRWTPDQADAVAPRTVFVEGHLVC